MNAQDSSIVKRYDLLGKVLFNALRFAEHGFPSDEVYIDWVQSEEPKPAGEFFEQIGKRWFVRSDSLPGHVAIKAIGATEKELLLETTMIDHELANQALDEVRYSESKRGFFAKSGERLIKIMKRGRKRKADLDERCLWLIPWPKHFAAMRCEMLMIADTIYCADAFQTAEQSMAIEAPLSVPAAMKLSQRLELGLRQTLELEQRPELALSLDLQLQQLLSLERLLLSIKDDPDQMNEFLASQELTPERQKNLVNAILFTVAGMVKKGNPDLSWKEARKIARDTYNSILAQHGLKKKK